VSLTSAVTFKIKAQVAMQGHVVRLTVSLEGKVPVTKIVRKVAPATGNNARQFRGQNGKIQAD